MTLTEQITLPGFWSDVHAYGYQLANLSPVPFELGLERYGFELIYPEISLSHIFPNYHGCVSLYKSLDKTLKSIQKFSDKDARSWNEMFKEYKSNRELIISSFNSPPTGGQIEHAKGVSSNDELTKSKTALAGVEFRRRTQSMRSWCDEHFESDEIKAMFGTFAAFVGLSPEDAGGGDLCYLFAAIIQDGGNNVVKGGFVNLPMALAGYLKSKGGKIMTSSGVRRILIENRRAVAVELTNGKIIGARRLVASSPDPFTLIFKLIGEDYVDPDISAGIKRLEWGDSIFGIYLALSGPLKYRSEQEVVAKSAQVHISPPGLEYFSRIFYECRSGKLPSNPLPIMSNDSMMDPTRIVTTTGGTASNFNNNNHLIKFLILSVPYQLKKGNDSEIAINEWERVKDHYADQIIEMINHDYVPNLKDIILKKVAFSPIDYEKRPINSIRGTLSCGAVLPYQSGWMRPIPQLGNYKIPSIPNVYLCGSGSHPGPGVSMAPGRNAAK